MGEREILLSGIDLVRKLIMELPPSLNDSLSSHVDVVYSSKNGAKQLRITFILPCTDGNSLKITEYKYNAKTNSWIEKRKNPEEDYS